MDNSSAIATVQQLIETAALHRASDIHLECTPDGVRVRYRYDGLLNDVMSIPAYHATRVMSRLKVLGQLDIGEKRIPQDGAFVATIPSGTLDIRIATFPARYGEKIVLRLLDHAQGVLSLPGLGLTASCVEVLLALGNRSQGLIIVTGPTGCGKTTTLYALLSAIASSEKNIMTLEDPVEYSIPGTTQAHIRSDIGFGFAEGIRAVLRQDPDIIMLGEIRDAETARAAIRAALTGHLVLTTLHTTDALGALTRLSDMGIEPFLINAVVIGVLAQRLVRTLCACRRVGTPAAEARKNGVQQSHEPHGCVDCTNRGYHGRTGLFELLVMDDAVREAVTERAPYVRLQELAQKQGMQTLLHHGVEKINEGVTSWNEVMRVLS